MDMLSNRELQVLELIAHEHSTREIAKKLFVSFETVTSHRKRILKKMNVKNTAGMIRVAFENEILPVYSTQDHPASLPLIQ